MRGVPPPTGGCPSRGGSASPKGILSGRRRVALSDDGGSQTVELALLMPALAMIVLAILLAGVAASEAVLAQAAARDGARVAAVDDDAAAADAAKAVAGERAVVVDVEPPTSARRAGELVTVTVRLRSRALQRLGVELWFPARATMRVEGL